MRVFLLREASLFTLLLQVCARELRYVIMLQKSKKSAFLRLNVGLAKYEWDEVFENIEINMGKRSLP